MLSDDTVLFLSFSHLNFEFVSNFVFRISRFSALIDLISSEPNLLSLFAGHDTRTYLKKTDFGSPQNACGICDKIKADARFNPEVPAKPMPCVVNTAVF